MRSMNKYITFRICSCVHIKFCETSLQSINVDIVNVHNVQNINFDTFAYCYHLMYIMNKK